MDFTRNNLNENETTSTKSFAGKPSVKGLSKFARLVYVLLLFAATILIVAMAGLIAFGNGNQAKYIDTSKYQAVFLNDVTGSNQTTYVGHITSLTDKYIVLNNVYLVTPVANKAGNYNLSQLGCQQAYNAYNPMVINLTNVDYWENLQDSGKVVAAINNFQAQNPNGANCSTVNINVSSTQNSTSTTTNTTK